MSNGTGDGHVWLEDDGGPVLRAIGAALAPQRCNWAGAACTHPVAVAVLARFEVRALCAQHARFQVKVLEEGQLPYCVVDASGMLAATLWDEVRDVRVVGGAS